MMKVAVGRIETLGEFIPAGRRGRRWTREREKGSEPESSERPQSLQGKSPCGSCHPVPGQALASGPEAPLFPPPRGEAPHTVQAQCPHPSPLVSMVPGPPSSSCPFLYEEGEQAARGQGGRERQAAVTRQKEITRGGWALGMGFLQNPEFH